MPWVDIPNSVFEAGKPARALDMRSLRDNFAAMANAESGAPLVKAGWHFYDAALSGDAATGLLFSHAVNGDTDTIQTPVFDPFYEYLMVWENLSRTSVVSGVNFDLQLRLTQTGAYTISTRLSTAFSSNNHFGFCSVARPHLVRSSHHVSYGNGDAAVAANTIITPYVTDQMIVRGTDTAIDRMRLFTSGTGTLQIRRGKAWLFKRFCGAVA